MATVEGRLSRIEGGYEHLATKADVERLKVWLFAAIVGGNLATAGLMLAVIRLWVN